MNITLYKSATCPQCKVVKAKLDKKGLAYTECLIENMDAAALSAANVKSIPTLFVDGEKMTDLRAMCRWVDAQEVSNG